MEETWEEIWEDKLEQLQKQLQKRLRPLGYKAHDVVFAVRGSDITAAIARYLVENNYDAQTLTDEDLKLLVGEAMDACYYVDESLYETVKNLIYCAIDTVWSNRLQNAPVSTGEVTTL